MLKEKGKSQRGKGGQYRVKRKNEGGCRSKSESRHNDKLGGRSGKSVFTGGDCIKTSTGKEGVNAILPVGLVMVRAIREYHERTGYKVL